MASSTTINANNANVNQLNTTFHSSVPVLAKTADYTITSEDIKKNTLFTNRGASGAVVLTLPTASQDLAGHVITVITVVAQTLQVNQGAANLIRVGGTSTSLTTPGAIGAFIEVFCDGSSFYAIGSNSDDGSTNGMNYTAA